MTRLVFCLHYLWCDIFAYFFVRFVKSETQVEQEREKCMYKGCFLFREIFHENILTKHVKREHTINESAQKLTKIMKNKIHPCQFYGDGVGKNRLSLFNPAYDILSSDPCGI